MKKLFVSIVALLCLSLFIPGAFAGDPEACFQPSLRVGVAFDIQQPLYNFKVKTGTLGGIRNTELTLDAAGRPYVALSLPFAVTDRLTVAVEGDWSFSGSNRTLHEQINNLGITRVFDSDGTSHWVSAGFFVSYALVKDAPVIKDLSVVAGLRWDYQTMSFDNAHNALGVLSSPADTVDFTMQTLAPVAGLACTFTGLKRGIWWGDVHLSVLGGPIVWGHEDYRETIGNVDVMTYKGDIDRGYLVRAYGDFTLLSGKIAPRLDGSLSFFAQFTRTSLKGEVDGVLVGLIAPGSSRVDFTAENTVMVLGFNGTLLFDICGRPGPVPPPTSAPAIEPKLEPMSHK